MPDASEMTIGIIALVAQAERRMISDRAKAALAAAKERGLRLGGRPENLRNGAAGSAAGAASLGQLAAGLNDRGIPTARGGRWSAVQVSRVLERAGA